MIEFPNYRPIRGEDKYDVSYLRREKVMLGIQSGVRINFGGKTLKGFGIGLAYHYRFKPAFEFHLVGTDLFLNSRVDELKLELLYFLPNKK
jgi:hypothetical protein